MGRLQGRTAVRLEPDANIPVSKRANEAMQRRPKPVKQFSGTQAAHKQGEHWRFVAVATGIGRGSASSLWKRHHY
jgi:hypothetical protein